MPRTKGSKNRPKTNTDYATQIAEKQEAITSLNTEITTITANVDALKADLKAKKVSLKKAEKELISLEAKMFFVKHFSLKKASEFPVFSEGFSLL